MDWEGSALIRWLYARCGKSEEANRAIKEDFAGGKLPSAGFYENAAWWWIAVLAYNLNAIMKALVMGGDLDQAQDEGDSIWFDMSSGSGSVTFSNASGTPVQRTSSFRVVVTDAGKDTDVARVRMRGREGRNEHDPGTAMSFVSEKPHRQDH